MLGIIFIALAAIEVYVQSEAFSARIRPYVAKPLAAILGPDVQFGRVKANFIPLFIEIRDISLPAAPGRPTTIRKVRAYVNPFPLLVKRISVPLIFVLEPAVEIERSRRGNINMEPFIQQVRARMAEKKPGVFRPYLSAITIKSGTISYDDKKVSMRFTAAKLNVNAWVDLPGRKMKVVVNSAEIHAEKGGNILTSGRLKTTTSVGKTGLDVDSLEFLSTDAIFWTSGNIGMFPDGNLDLNVRLLAGQEAMGKLIPGIWPFQKREGASLNLTGRIRGTAAQPSVTGSFTISGLAFKAIRFGPSEFSFAYDNRRLDLEGAHWRLLKGAKKTSIDTMSASLAHRDGGVEIQRFAILAEDLQVHLSGHAHPLAGYDIVVSAESTGSNRTLSFMTSIPIGGRVGVKGKLTGPLASPLFNGVLSALPLKVRGVQFDEIGGTLMYRDKKISLSSAVIRQQKSNYVFNGMADLGKKRPLYTARVAIERSDAVSIVSLFYKKPLPLTLTASGTLSFAGTRRNYTAKGFLSLGPGVAYGESFDKGSISVTLTPDSVSFPRVMVTKGSGLISATGRIGFDRTYSASLAARDIDLAAVDRLANVPFAGKGVLRIDSSGPFANPAVKASLAVPRFYSDQASLGGVMAELDLKNHVLSLKTAMSDDRLYLAGDISLRPPHTWALAGNVTLSDVDPFLLAGKKELVARSLVALDGVIKLDGRGLNLSRMNGTCTMRRLGISIDEFSMETEGDAGFTLSRGRLTLKPFDFKGPQTHFSVSGGAKLIDEMDLKVTGRADLSLLRVMFTEIEHGEGSAELALTIEDELTNPTMTGELRIENGEVKVKDLPQNVTALNGKIRLGGRQIVIDLLTGEVGGGRLHASGWVNFMGRAIQDFTSTVTFENVTVRFPEGLTSTLIGELSYDGDAAGQTLSGEVEIERARYDKRVEWKSMLMDMARGFYQKKKTDVGWIGASQLNVRFYGKDNILFDNNLAKMPLDVDIFLRGTVDQPQVFGRIETRNGTVFLRKNNFKIINASVDFIDPYRMNPVLDIQAETRVREYQIRLALSGTAEQSTLSLVSDPPLSDVDILSLLALGKTGEELTGKGTGVGMSEAASFATGQFQDIFERRARSFTGLDRFQIDPYVGKGDTSVPRITVGKEVVEDKLYVTYSSNVGTAEADQLIRMEYILGEHFSLLGERNEMGNIGADIKFRFEFK